MKRVILYTLLLAAALSGCGRRTETPPVTEDTPTTQEQTQNTAPAVPEDTDATAETLGRPQKADLEFTVEGQMETIPATLHLGRGYSIYIPDTDWRLEGETDDGIPEESWESTLNHDVELTVSRYDGMTEQEARAAFAAHKDDYIFEDLMGGGWGDPLFGVDDEGDTLAFMSREGAGVAYVVSWKYPAEAAEGFGIRLSRIAETFELAE